MVIKLTITFWDSNKQTMAANSAFNWASDKGQANKAGNFARKPNKFGYPIQKMSVTICNTTVFSKHTQTGGGQSF